MLRAKATQEDGRPLLILGLEKMGFFIGAGAG